MAENHRSAMGKMVDMAALRAQNEQVRAVGNMNMNARGDIIDSNGNVINDNNKRVNEYYMKSVMNRGPARQVLVPQNKKAETPEAVSHPAPSMPVADTEPPVAASVATPVVQEPPQPLFTAEEMEFEEEEQTVQLPVKEEPVVEKRETPKKISLSKKID